MEDMADTRTCTFSVRMHPRKVLRPILIPPPDIQTRGAPPAGVLRVHAPQLTDRVLPAVIVRARNLLNAVPWPLAQPLVDVEGATVLFKDLRDTVPEFGIKGRGSRPRGVGEHRSVGLASGVTKGPSWGGVEVGIVDVSAVDLGVHDLVGVGINIVYFERGVVAWTRAGEVLRL